MCAVIDSAVARETQAAGSESEADKRWMHRHAWMLQYTSTVRSRTDTTHYTYPLFF